MVFVATPFGGEEAVLTHIKVETLEAAVAKTTYGTGFANIAFRLMPG